MVLAFGKYLGNDKLVQDLLHYRLTLNLYDSHEKLPKHCHEYPYLSVAIKGYYQELTDMKGIPPSIVDQRSILYRPAGYVHSNEFNKMGGACFNIEFKDQSFLKSIFPFHQEVVVIPNNLDVTRIFYSFLNNESTAVLELHIQELLVGLTKSVYVQNHSSIAKKAAHYIEEHADQAFSLSEIGSQLQVHPVYLSRAFKKTYSKTIGEYLSQVRLRNAFYGLGNQEKLTTLAYSKGFYDQSHFIRSFQKEFGTSPGAARKELSRLI